MLFIADAMRDSPNNPVVGLVDQVPPPGPGMPMPWPRGGTFCCGGLEPARPCSLKEKSRENDGITHR